jgi:hypothetical protein
MAAVCVRGNESWFGGERGKGGLGCLQERYGRRTPFFGLYHQEHHGGRIDATMPFMALPSGTF